MLHSIPGTTAAKAALLAMVFSPEHLELLAMHIRTARDIAADERPNRAAQLSAILGNIERAEEAAR